MICEILWNERVEFLDSLVGEGARECIQGALLLLKDVGRVEMIPESDGAHLTVCVEQTEK